MSSIRPLHINDLPFLKKLFTSYPYKKDQQRFQGLTPKLSVISLPMRNASDWKQHRRQDAG